MCDLPRSLEFHSLGVLHLHHPGDVLLAVGGLQDAVGERSGQVVLVDLERVHGGVEVRLEVLVQPFPHEHRDRLLLVEELVGREVGRHLGDHVHAHKLEELDVVTGLRLELGVEAVKALRVLQQAVLEGQSQDQRQAVEGPAVQDVHVHLVVLHGLDRLGVLDQRVHWPDEHQAGTGEDLRVDGLEDVVVLQGHVRGRQGGE
mmetsp:Transcript_87870/g.196431  ORF Transcript_87870/g.196431 Transcript_87870/m.196431 type:complete len:202 (-) Transcript_87870:153-758(-)